jgi:hypothetical protein
VAGALTWTLPVPPPVQPHDVDRFPPDPVIEEARAGGRLYRAALRDRMATSPHRPELADALVQSERAERAWCELYLVRDGPPSWDGQVPAACATVHLAWLRDLIGPAAYAAGAMPSLCPPWAFTPVD